MTAIELSDEEAAFLRKLLESFMKLGWVVDFVLQEDPGYLSIRWKDEGALALTILRQAFEKADAWHPHPHHTDLFARIIVDAELYGESPAGDVDRR